jgi:hypothetical protein
MAFTRSDDGSWTIVVAEERAVVTEEHTAQSDLVMTHALEIFAKTAFKFKGQAARFFTEAPRSKRKDFFPY